MYRDRIDAFLKSHYIPMLLLSLVVLGLTYRFFSDIGDLFACGVTCIFSMIILCMACMVDVRKTWYLPVILIVAGAVLWCLRQNVGYETEGAFMIMFAGVSTLCYCFPHLQSGLAFWGGMSFEFYIMHFLPLEFLYSDVMSNAYVAFLLSLLMAMLLTYVTWRVVSFVLERYNDGLKRIESSGLEVA